MNLTSDCLKLPRERFSPMTRSGLSAIKAGSWAEPLPQAFVLPASLRT